jgi:signal transduction histidine kinase
MSLFSSLTNRIFVATAALTVLAIAIAVYQINVAVTAQAENELRRGLEEAGTLVEEHRTTMFEHFAREARLVADTSNLKAAMATRDAPTVQPLADRYQRSIASDLFVVTDPQGRVLAESGRVRMPQGDQVVQETIREATTGNEATALWPVEGGVLQVVSVPSYTGSELMGTVIVGSSLDAESLARFKALTNSEIAFALRGRVKASTLDAGYNGRLETLIGHPNPTQIELGDSVYAALSRPLSLAFTDGGIATSSLAATALILRNRTERLRFLSDVHRRIAVTAFLAVMAATLLSYFIARTITRPLGAITATMRDMAATGDLTRRLPERAEGRWEDEDARLLASTFNTMTDSIAKFQREAGQRERLSSLGRLSTVIAHEIRNPLMIIKTALRPLKGASVSPDAVRTAAADIDEEVARLNRIVTEVLDFARPINFERAPADINALCADAVRAIQSESPEVSIVIDLESRLPEVETDAERLRLALVNILTNARHAVQAASPVRRGATTAAKGSSGPRDDRSGASALPLIRVTTRRAGPSRVSIEVRDRGTGIAAEDLPRVFDPYFTTRRTGTGLGLAISRNIIEGLGGTIGVTSRPGSGTEVSIELPTAIRG